MVFTPKGAVIAFACAFLGFVAGGFGSLFLPLISIRLNIFVAGAGGVAGFIVGAGIAWLIGAAERE